MIELLIVACMWYLILVTFGSYVESRLERRMARGFGGASRQRRGVGSGGRIDALAG